MPRKRWTPQAEITPSLLKFREKRKWQISLRRYVLKRHTCPAYAPYFGLDNQTLRKWFEYQFHEGVGWEDFGEKWQFDHIIPVTFFDHSIDSELLLCWNFTNLRIEDFQKNKNRGNRVDIIGAKSYFRELFDKTGYHITEKMFRKIESIEISEIKSTKSQQDFLMEHISYLNQIEGYSVFEFELLNSGRSIEEVKKEIDQLNMFEGRTRTE